MGLDAGGAEPASNPIMFAVGSSAADIVAHPLRPAPSDRPILAAGVGAEARSPVPQGLGDGERPRSVAGSVERFWNEREPFNAGGCVEAMVPGG